MTTIKDYLESAMSCLGRARIEAATPSVPNSVSFRACNAIDDATEEVREIAKVLGVQLEYGRIKPDAKST